MARPWWRRYRPAWLRVDLVAGLTVWAVLVPEALAYATIAGVSPVVGLYAAVRRAGPVRRVRQLPAPGRRADVGHRGAVGRRSSPSWPTAGPGKYVALTAALALSPASSASWPACCGWASSPTFISEPVLKGFIVGLALTIIIGQLPKLFGVERGDGDFFEQLWGCSATSATRSGWHARGRA